MLTWEGVEARVSRPDVHAINGVIHVIDNVLMKKRDMTTSAATSSLASVSLFSALLTLFAVIKL